MTHRWLIVILLMLSFLSACNNSADTSLDGIALVSVSSAGAQGNRSSYEASISATGRYIAFWSWADNLISYDTNGKEDIFVHDRETAQTTRVSVSSMGEQGNDWSSDPSISANGRYIAFESNASNLVSDDTNGTQDIFVHDRETGHTSRVSVSSAGEQGYYDSRYPSISANGRYIVFDSRAGNLVSDDTNSMGDVFVHDQETGHTSRVSVSNTGEQGNDWSFDPRISADGRYITFYSKANNLVSDDTNGTWDIFVHDQETGHTSRVSVSNTGEQKYPDFYDLSISADGRYIAFWSLISHDTNLSVDIFVHDREIEETTRIAVSDIGTQGNSFSYYPSISADGRYIAFWSLVSHDTNSKEDIFVHDRKTGHTSPVSVNSMGIQGNSDSYRPRISADGRYITFESDANNLVSNDANHDADIFVAPNPLYTTDTLGSLLHSGSH